MYNYWLQFPRKKDLEICSELEYRYKISKSSAYDDVRIIKRLLGDLAKTTKDYHRYKFCQMIDETFLEMARRIKDARAMGLPPIIMANTPSWIKKTSWTKVMIRL